MKRQRTYGHVLYSPLLHNLFTIRSTKKKNYRNFRLLVTPTHFDVQIDSNLTALGERQHSERQSDYASIHGLQQRGVRSWSSHSIAESYLLFIRGLQTPVKKRSPSIHGESDNLLPKRCQDVFESILDFMYGQEITMEAEIFAPLIANEGCGMNNWCGAVEVMEAALSMSCFSLPSKRVL